MGASASLRERARSSRRAGLVYSYIAVYEESVSEEGVVGTYNPNSRLMSSWTSTEMVSG
jgi:hypothetical protein